MRYKHLLIFYVRNSFMRRLVILFLVLLVAASLVYFFWPSLQHNYDKMTLNKEEELKELQNTKELLNSGKPEEAWQIIQEHSNEINFNSEIGREWLEQLIRASEFTLNIPQLQLLYEYYPKAFDSHEKAALLIANQYLSSNRGKEYQTVREGWKGREIQPEVWFVLDADLLLLEGKRKEAIEFLNSRSFPGKHDSSRLIRLALLYVFEQPKVAWEYLTLAYSKDPENPDIRSYRAKLLETVGKSPLALTEYQAAVQADPKNLYLKDQLAEFYIRSRQYPEALKIWLENLKSPSLDAFWLKALFWSRVATPAAFNWHSEKPPQGNLEPLIDYLLTLKPGVFWDVALFERIPDGQNFLKQQQVTFWLRLLEQIKLGKEKEAYDLLQYNPFSSVSWNPKLEEELKRILLYRKTGHFVPEANPIDAASSGHQPTPSAQDKTPLFARIDAIVRETPPHVNLPNVPADLHELLKGPEVFALALITAGWDEAGLQLHSLSVIPPYYPEWVSLEIAKAIHQNRGANAALEFAKLQMATPALSLLTGELLIAKGNSDEALEHLIKLKGDKSEIGYRAAWLMSLIYIERAHYAEATSVINEQPTLSQDILGKETLARIALLEGDNEKADAMYSAMEKSSPEAQSYLARKAFQNKDWKRARELTEALLKQYPDNSLLRDNLKKIMEQQK
jgi:hypothetical protein